MYEQLPTPVDLGPTRVRNRIEVIKIGDAIAPRTVEEAVLDGFNASWNL